MLDIRQNNHKLSFEYEARQVGFQQFIQTLLRTLLIAPLGWILIISLAFGVAPLDKLLAWSIWFFVSLIIILFFLNQLLKKPPDINKNQTFVLFIVAYYGLLWGMMAYGAMGYDVVLDSWVLTILVGIVSVNLPSYITFPKAFYFLVFGMWLSTTLSVLLILDRYDLGWKAVFGILIYVISLLYVVKPISNRVLEGIRMQLLNKSLAEELQKSLKTVSHQANTDALTGLHNRHALNKSLEELIVKGERRRNTFSLLMIDIDFFKDINDKYGHGVGDKAIQHVAMCISGQLRDDDMCARFGGEEFVVLLPNTSTTEAMYVAERIRKAVEVTPMQNPFQPMTLSIGVATHQYGMTSEMLLKAADDEVYVAKANGRNQVRVSETDTFNTLPKINEMHI
ncbi:MAG: GGDEF domain-containing protein [Oceanospirillales bacterium]|nr:MAG: GGDEF domain-containing protein [Oceanospirillales bacterium]